MDLSTTYLGLKLRSPLVASASPLSQDIDNIKKMEEHGAGAVVLHSLFEEQIRQESLELERGLSQGSESFAEALSYFPQPSEFRLGPQEYLEHIQKAKRAVSIPVIASLNGSSSGGWTSYAARMQEAGADALELNIYAIPTDLDRSGSQIEESTTAIVQEVRKSVDIPVAVKLSPFYSNLANVAQRLEKAGANGLVLFNRFYQPDIDLEALEVKPGVVLSTPFALRLPLRWIAILHGRVGLDLAATSGVHDAADAVKLLMVGAKVTMMCSALLRNGIPHLRKVTEDLRTWLERHDYKSVEQMQGSMSQKNAADPSAFERAQYMRALQSYSL